MAWETGPYDGDYIWEGEDHLEDYGADAVDYDDGVLVHCGDGGDEAVAVVPWVEVETVSGCSFDLFLVSLAVMDTGRLTVI